MSRGEVIPLRKDRPAVITQDGWIWYVSIHDAEYMRVLKAWKQKLVAAHPDRGGTATAFRKVMGQRLRWQCEEAQWYAQIGLLPPDGFEHAKQRVERTRRLRGLKE